MNDPVAVPAEIVAGGAYRLRDQPPPALGRIGGINGALFDCIDRHGGLTPKLAADWRCRPAHLTIQEHKGQLMTAEVTGSVTASERAARRLGEILKKEPEGAMRRV